MHSEYLDFESTQLHSTEFKIQSCTRKINKCHFLKSLGYKIMHDFGMDFVVCLFVRIHILLLVCAWVYFSKNKKIKKLKEYATLFNAFYNSELVLFSREFNIEMIII